MFRFLLVALLLLQVAKCEMDTTNKPEYVKQQITNGIQQESKLDTVQPPQQHLEEIEHSEQQQQQQVKQEPCQKPKQEAKKKLVKKKKYDMSQIVFVVLSQKHPRHAAIGDVTKKTLVKNLKKWGVKKPKVFTLHKDLTITGGWTITPLMSILIEETHPRTEWYAFLDEASEVNLEILNQILLNHEAIGEFFIGHAIKDDFVTIIHHHDKTGLRFPDFKAGFIMSRPLVKYISKEMGKGPFALLGLPVDHSIDVPFELAKAIKLLPSRQGARFDPVLNQYYNGGPLLEHDPRFCTSYSPECAFYPRDTTCPISREKSDVLVEQTLFAVKTCKANHETRLPIVQGTWGSAARNIIYVSEEVDSDYGTTTLPGGDFNTIMGHCNRTESILKHFARTARQNNWKWLVIADDDTILSVSKLMDAIQCYDKDDGEKFALGERFGFRVNGPAKQIGSDFLVGGSSMVFNIDLVEHMVDSSHNLCTCEHPGYPDDIHLGECLFRLNVSLVHHDQFHQVRPEDYHPSRLAHQGALSFHKFENTDPINTYNTWFKSHDQHLTEKYTSNESSNNNSNSSNNSNNNNEINVDIAESKDSIENLGAESDREAQKENNYNTPTESENLHQEL